MSELLDVAARAGVPPSTALRALNRPETMRAEALARVRAAARDLGYPLTGNRRSPTRTTNIAVVVPDLQSGFYQMLSHSIAAVGRDLGYSVRVLDSIRDSSRERALVASAARSTDGIILCSPLRDHARSLDGAPIVYVNKWVHGANCVLLDQRHVVELQIAHLVDLGHRRILWGGGQAGCWVDDVRRRRVTRLAADHDIHLLPPVGLDSVSGARLVDLLDTDTTAVALFNDRQAFGFVKRARERGIRIPDDVSVVSADDALGCEWIEPPLTTVRTPWEAFGRAAFGLLAGLWARDNHVVFETLRGTLVVRESTAPLRRGKGRRTPG